MRSRYVVEVVEEKASPEITPTQTVELESPLPISSEPSPQVISRPVADFPVAPSHSPETPPQPIPQRAQPPQAWATTPQASREQLFSKINASVELPVVESSSYETGRGGQNQADDVPDLFERAQPTVHRAWQHVALESAHEVPSVTLPRAPRSRRIHPETTLSNAPKTERLERIERLFSNKPGRSDGGTVPPTSTRHSSTSQSSREPSQQWNFQKKKRKGGGFFIFLTVLVLFVAGTGVGAYAWLRYDISHTVALAESWGQNLKGGHMVTAEEQLEQLKHKNQRYQTLYRVTRPISSLVLGKEKSTHIDQLLLVSDTGLRVAEEGFDTYDNLAVASNQFLGNTPGTSTDTLASVSGQLETLYSNLSGLQAEVASLDNPFQWEWIDEVQARSKTDLPPLRRSLLASQQLLTALPELIGQTGQRQYLILLQNNSELRPTGGFIGSIGILTVENGKFVDFRVEDVYEADGQLNGFVEPPAELKAYLGEAQWYLRDVNWSPDFPTVAEQARWFLDKTLGIQADGVIAVNLAVAQRLLAATGPVELVDYNEVITQDNLYERAQLHAEVNFFPGSTQKRDFLSAVANSLFQKLIAGESSAQTVLPALYSSAGESHLLVSVNNPAASNVFRGLGWDGSLGSPECPPPFSLTTCQVDTVMQVEANVGVNKANQYLQRQITHSVDVTDTAAMHTRKIVLTNASQSNAWPQGAYKSYFRLFVSPQAQLESVTIDGQNVAFNDVTQQGENGKQVFGVLVNVPVRSTSEVEVKYSVPLVSGWKSYALFEQKQSGTGVMQNGAPSDLVTHRLRVVGGKVSTVAPEPVIEGDTVVFSSQRKTHEFMAIER